MISAATASSGRDVELFTEGRSPASSRQCGARGATSSELWLWIPDMRFAHSGTTFRNYASRQCAHTPVISITGAFGVKPALFAAAFRLTATAADGASPTLPQCSQIRN